MHAKQTRALSPTLIQRFGMSLLLAAGCAAGPMDEQDLERSVGVGAGFVAPLTAKLEVHGAPNGTPILVDGVFAGFVGPAPLEVTPGAHEIQAAHPCSGRSMTMVTTSGERTTHVEVPFVRPYATVEFRVRSADDDELSATIVRSGQYLGRSSEPYEVATCDTADEQLRTTDFEIAAPGYYSADITAVLEPGESRRVEVELKARDAESSLSTAQLEAAEERCASGSANACFNAGYLHASGRVVSPDGAQAGRHFLAACQKGMLAGCYNAARAALRLPLSAEKRETARKLWALSCEHGFGLSCNNLAWTYEAGLGVDIDYLKAFEFYDQACKLSSRTGCSGVASLRYKGVFPAEKRDVAGAFAGYYDACHMETSEPGHNWGCFFAAKIIETSPAVVPEALRTEASRMGLLKLACNGGVAKACRKPTF